MWAQTKPEIPVDIQTIALNLEPDIPKWLLALNSIDLTKLPVSYAEGKVIEQNVSTAKENVQFISRVTTRVVTERRLGDEIRLFAALTALQDTLHDTTYLLMSTNPRDQGTVAYATGLAHKLSDIANGELNDRQTEMYKFLIHHSDEIESKGCANGASR
jgi:hypothetical protein